MWRVVGSSYVYLLLLAWEGVWFPQRAPHLGLQPESGSSQTWCSWTNLDKVGQGGQRLRPTGFMTTGGTPWPEECPSWRKACWSAPQYTDKKRELPGGRGGYIRSLWVAEQPLEPRCPRSLSRLYFTNCSLILTHRPVCSPSLRILSSGQNIVQMSPNRLSGWVTWPHVFLCKMGGMVVTILTSQNCEED